MTTAKKTTRQLGLWEVEDHQEAVTTAARQPARAANRPRAEVWCPTCGHRPVSAAEAARMREDLGVLWLHAAAAGVREAYHCQQCQPRGRVADTECSSCLAGGPLLADELAVGKPPAAVAHWLARHGWTVTAAGELLCPMHRAP